MRKTDPLSLGIEFNEREVRLVQAGVKSGKPFVVKSVAVPLPPGAMLGGVILETGTLVIGLQRALDALGLPAPTSATVGVSGEQCIFRTVTVPPCPDYELPPLVASEINHQNLLNPGDPYGFFPVYPADAAPDAMQSLAVIGVDASVTTCLVEVLEGVGMTVSSLEPTPLAMLRTATAGLAPNATAFVLIAGTSYTDAAYFADGKLSAIRRLDVGMESLVLPFVPNPWLKEYEQDKQDDDSEIPEEIKSHIDGDATDRLALEAQRTLDYVQRASRGTASIERVRMVSDDPQVDSLAIMLERRLGLPIEVVRPLSTAGEEPEARFSAAYGLAVRTASTGVATPILDLFTAERTAARRGETKRYFLGSVFVAVLSIAVGICGCLMYNGQILASRGRYAGAQTEIAAAQKTVAAALDARSEEAARDKALRKEGVPLGVLMDYVSNSLDSGVGLKLVTINDDLSVRIQGEAHDETALVRTAQALRSSPVLSDVAVDKFDRDEKDKAKAGTIKFDLSARTVSVERLSKEGTRG